MPARGSHRPVACSLAQLIGRRVSILLLDPLTFFVLLVLLLDGAPGHPVATILLDRTAPPRSCTPPGRSPGRAWAGCPSRCPAGRLASRTACLLLLSMWPHSKISLYPT